MTSEFDFDETPEAAQTRKLALDFANMYVVLFVHNTIGVQLLKHWEDSLMNKRTPVNAPLTEYAANEAVRAFIAGIKGQIKIAQDVAMR